MNIKDGDVVTLDNGQIVKVTLTPVEIVPIPGKKYKLRYTGQFCHWCSSYNSADIERRDLVQYIFQFIGVVEANVGSRAIFFCSYNNSYVMFNMNSYDYITQEVK